MQLVEKFYNPFIRKNDSTAKVMTDVIIALLPSMAVTWFAYGFTPVLVLMVAIGSALIAEFLFDTLFKKDTRSLGDGSAIVTGILLSFTIGPFTPLPVVAVGSASAVIFGKLLWGGLGRNRFNPALAGREIIVVLFPVIMNSSKIFNNKELLQHTTPDLFGSEVWNKFLFTPSGAIGEYSPVLLVIGGLYLLWRRRITWHIPFFMIIAFIIATILFRDKGISFSLGGLLLGAIYMATDMPTSSSTNNGKIYFATMTGIIALACLLFGASRGYLSYSILIMNGFVVPINWIFRTRVWGRKKDIKTTMWQTALLTSGIIVTTAFVLLIHNLELLLYPVIIYMLYSVIRFIYNERKNREQERQKVEIKV